MHCLEDAVEYLEYLPEEIRKKCIELQQLDSRNTVELSKLVAETRSFFSNFGSSFNAIDSEKKNKEFLDRFQELRDNGEEKVQITEYLHLVLEKYQERIAKDIAEFKAELEIDNPGETDIIEKSFMQAVSEQPILVDDISKVGDETEQQFEASRPSTSTTICGLDANRVNGHRTIVAADGEVTPKRLKQFEEFKIPANFRRITPQIGDQTSSPSWTMFDEDIFDAELTPPVKRPRLAPPGRQPSFTVPQDPREPAQLPHREIQYPSFPHSNSSTSLKTEYMLSSSYPARLSEGDFAVPSSSRQQPAAIRMPLLAGAPTRHGRPRKLTKKVEQMLIGTRAPGLHSQQLGEQGRPSFRTIHRGGHRQTSMKRMPQQRRTTADGQGEEEEELDEERYSFDDEEEDEDEGEEEEDGDDEEEADDNRAWCICKQGSHGNMVACDNKNCPYEWFHYECVGIQQPPKGRWYCPTCQMQISMRRSRSASSDLARRD